VNASGPQAAGRRGASTRERPPPLRLGTRRTGSDPIPALIKALFLWDLPLAGHLAATVPQTRYNQTELGRPIGGVGQMYAEERQQQIIQRARQDGRVDVGGLATGLSVTPETIRRDLTVLERQGLLRRVHGGAIPIERIGFEPQLAVRTEHMAEEKARIAKAALAELPTEGAILLDAGSTTQRLAELLPTDRELTVITNALPIAQLLASRLSVTVITLGGRVRGRTLAEVDAIAVRTLEGFSVDVAFLGTNGISVERGLTTPDLAEAEIKRTMCRNARRRVLLADHTKVGNDTLCSFADVTDIDVFITDTGLDDELAAELETAGLTVLRA